DEAAWIGKPIPPDQRAMREIQGSEVRVAEGLDGRLRIIAAATPDGPLAGVRVVVGRDHAEIGMTAQDLLEHGHWP
ncbi:hypothetical protein ACP3WA_26710, partial [Salmonella enterica]|uniref:hypothetical protein n=1 Tax=Salmonella enterica TaxID=28901 RepID=UPI003CEDAD4A